MSPHRMAAALALAATSVLASEVAAAGCPTATTGARCVVVPASETTIEVAALSSASSATPAVAVGEVVGRGEYSILINADYYGLPAVSDGWVYMRVGSDVFRVDWRSHEVLERVTDRVAANF